MNANDVKQIIQGHFTDNCKAYPDDYRKSPDTMIVVTAHGYWDNRTLTEMKRDKKLKITKADYVQWCRERFKELNKQIEDEPLRTVKIFLPNGGVDYFTEGISGVISIFIDGGNGNIWVMIKHKEGEITYNGMPYILHTRS